jgi:hypothetical protein
LKTPSDVFKTSLRATARLHFRFQTAIALLAAVADLSLELYSFVFINNGIQFYTHRPYIIALPIIAGVAAGCLILVFTWRKSPPA